MTPIVGTEAVEPIEVIEDRRINPDREANVDRRKSPRKRVLRGGLTAWPNGDSTACTVHNLSATGAHLQIRGPVPRTFNLIIDGDHVSRSCCVVWRNASRVGVKFEGELEIAALKSSFKHHAKQCRALAQGAVSADRDTLLSMANAWEALARRFRIRRRLAEAMPY